MLSNTGDDYVRKIWGSRSGYIFTVLLYVTPCSLVGEYQRFG